MQSNTPLHPQHLALIESLKRSGVLHTPHIIEAFRRIDRKHFVQPEYAAFVYEDKPLPIGEGQTISQPYTVAFMIESLQPKPGDHIMEIGHGSAWQTTMLADIVEERGRIYAIELIPTLCTFGRTNVAHYPALQQRISWYCQNADAGLPKEARAIGGFSGIIAAAAVRQAPEAWRAQLRIGGYLVYPKDGMIVVEHKVDARRFSVHEYPGFAFVPFVTSRRAS